MFVLFIVLFSLTIPCSRAAKVATEAVTFAPMNLNWAFDLALDAQVGSGADYKIPSVLQFVPSSCGRNNTCSGLATIANIYEEMGCTPSKTLTSFCCPVSYDCTKAYSSRSKTQCQYKGKTYSVGAKLPADPELPCITNIVCAMKDKVPGFTYKRTTCPILKYNATTIPLYNFTSCCATGTRSAKLSAKEFKCTYNKTSYPVGAQMPSLNVCEICICAKGFDGTLRAPWCQIPRCGYELDAQNILKGFASVNGLGRNCPFMWQKPSSADVVLPNPNNGKANSKAVCKFGSKDVRFGDGLISTVAATSCVLCGCLIPPTVSCGLLSDCSAALAYIMTNAGG